MELSDGDRSKLLGEPEVSIEDVLGMDMFLDRRVVKVFDGIAGAGKSSLIHRRFSELGIEYKRVTSTNKLARDSCERYRMPVGTIASELFRTENGAFYKKLKRTHYEHVVIDEILQSDQRVFDWIELNSGVVNIIVCTDSKQMVTQGQSQYMILRLEKLKASALVVAQRHTMRAINDKTRDIYESMYKHCGEGNLFRKVLPSFKRADAESMVYSGNDMYICHSNEIERYVYEKFGLYSEYSANLIPKGSIAKNVPKDLTRYPIIPQCMVNNNTGGYLQVSNVATPTRMQGCESSEDGNVYFLIERFSSISDSEIYTTVTRAKNIDNFYIVYVDTGSDRKFKLTKYNGKPVKDCGYLILDEDYTVDGEKVADLVECNEDGEKTIDGASFRKVMSSLFQDGNTHFHEYGFILGGEYIGLKGGDYEKPKISVMGMMNKEPELSLDYMDLFMRYFESAQVSSFGRMDVDAIRPAMSTYQERYADSPFPDQYGYVEVKNRRMLQYGIDLKSAYVHVLLNAALPTTYRISDKKGAYGCELDWYILYSSQCERGSLVPWSYIQELLKYEDAEYVYVCSTSCKKGSKTAARWHELCHKDKESNSNVKDIRWGILDRPWISGFGHSDDGTPGYYARNNSNRHQLLMAAIKAEQARVVMAIRGLVYGSIYKGVACADCLYFDYPGDIQGLGGRIAEGVPGYDFRIFRNSEEDKAGEILYQNFHPVLSKLEKKREAEKSRRKRLQNR